MKPDQGDFGNSPTHRGAYLKRIRDLDSSMPTTDHELRTDVRPSLLFSKSMPKECTGRIDPIGQKYFTTAINSLQSKTGLNRENGSGWRQESGSCNVDGFLHKDSIREGHSRKDGEADWTAGQVNDDVAGTKRISEASMYVKHAGEADEGHHNREIFLKSRKALEKAAACLSGVISVGNDPSTSAGTDAGKADSCREGSPEAVESGTTWSSARFKISGFSGTDHFQGSQTSRKDITGIRSLQTYDSNAENDLLSQIMDMKSGEGEGEQGLSQVQSTGCCWPMPVGLLDNDRCRGGKTSREVMLGSRGSEGDRENNQLFSSGFDLKKGVEKAEHLVSELRKVLSLSSASKSIKEKTEQATPHVLHAACKSSNAVVFADKGLSEGSQVPRDTVARIQSTDEGDAESTRSFSGSSWKDFGAKTKWGLNQARSTGANCRTSAMIAGDDHLPGTRTLREVMSGRQRTLGNKDDHHLSLDSELKGGRKTVEEGLSQAQALVRRPHTVATCPGVSPRQGSQKLGEVPSASYSTSLRWMADAAKCRSLSRPSSVEKEGGKGEQAPYQLPRGAQNHLMAGTLADDDRSQGNGISTGIMSEGICEIDTLRSQLGKMDIAGPLCSSASSDLRKVGEKADQGLSQGQTVADRYLVFGLRKGQKTVPDSYPGGARKAHMDEGLPKAFPPSAGSGGEELISVEQGTANHLSSGTTCGNRFSASYGTGDYSANPYLSSRTSGNGRSSCEITATYRVVDTCWSSKENEKENFHAIVDRYRVLMSKWEHLEREGRAERPEPRADTSEPASYANPILRSDKNDTQQVTHPSTIPAQRRSTRESSVQSTPVRMGDWHSTAFFKKPENATRTAHSTTGSPSGDSKFGLKLRPPISSASSEIRCDAVSSFSSFLGRFLRLSEDLTRGPAQTLSVGNVKNKAEQNTTSTCMSAGTFDKVKDGGKVSSRTKDDSWSVAFQGAGENGDNLTRARGIVGKGAEADNSNKNWGLISCLMAPRVGRRAVNQSDDHDLYHRKVQRFTDKSPPQGEVTQQQMVGKPDAGLAGGNWEVEGPGIPQSLISNRMEVIVSAASLLAKTLTELQDECKRASKEKASTEGRIDASSDSGVRSRINCLSMDHQRQAGLGDSTRPRTYDERPSERAKGTGRGESFQKEDASSLLDTSSDCRKDWTARNDDCHHRPALSPHVPRDRSMGNYLSYSNGLESYASFSEERNEDLHVRKVGERCIGSQDNNTGNTSSSVARLNPPSDARTESTGVHIPPKVAQRDFAVNSVQAVYNTRDCTRRGGGGGGGESGVKGEGGGGSGVRAGGGKGRSGDRGGESEGHEGAGGRSGGGTAPGRKSTMTDSREKRSGDNQEELLLPNDQPLITAKRVIDEQVASIVELMEQLQKVTCRCVP
ncbi:hypothetical protein CBR_g32006 [Chara braunii]|uniref:Uncharacterized protein n=1 Tax=Chara braunii TaxID=69332 RepID=A0A388LGL9_CHABU|nr:hypothetical protein CBR_g32006 [Chara braunii]|eukprot:GBG81332.1 hypothetical protein CBR_g32006 [Chara braunii]